MASVQEEKLKSLIAQSKILSPQERTEWSALLGMMSEKQQIELEKILLDGNEPKIATTSSGQVGLVGKQDLTQKAQQKPFTEAQPKVTPATPQTTQPVQTGQAVPNLSHILNLPKNFRPAPTPPPKVSAPVVSSEVQKPKEKKFSKFALKLKQIFKEKELPAAKPEPLLPEGRKEKVEPVQLVKKPAPSLPKAPPVVPKKPELPKENVHQLKEQKPKAPELKAAKKPVASPSPKPVAISEVKKPAEPVKEVRKKEEHNEEISKLAQALLKELKSQNQAPEKPLEQKPAQAAAAAPVIPAGVPPEVAKIANDIPKVMGADDGKTVVNKITFVMNQAGQGAPGQAAPTVAAAPAPVPTAPVVESNKTPAPTVAANPYTTGPTFNFVNAAPTQGPASILKKMGSQKLDAQDRINAALNPSMKSGIKDVAFSNANGELNANKDPNEEVNNILSTLSGPSAKKAKGPSSSGVAGLNIDRTSEQDREETLASIRKHVESSQFLKRVPKIAPTKELALQDLNDLALLSTKILDVYDFNPLVKKIKGLISKFGYYEVIFNIEKSPMYKLYVNTGVDLLKNQKDFEQLTGNESNDKYLNRMDFEEFADLLRQIQTG